MVATKHGMECVTFPKAKSRRRVKGLVFLSYHIYFWEKTFGFKLIQKTRDTKKERGPKMGDRRFSKAYKNEYFWAKCVFIYTGKIFPNLAFKRVK